jgi:hypothetical protein
MRSGGLRKLKEIVLYGRPFSGDRWLFLILFLTLTLRTYHLAYPAWDYHNWRQTITLMVARDLALPRHGFPLLHPQVSWIAERSSDPSYFSAEFSIQSVLAALLYKIFGQSEAAARLVTIAFSLLGICCLYDLLNRGADRTVARIGAFIFALLPYHLFFGRVFMPDVPALALALAGLDVLDHWTSHQRKCCLTAAGILTALAILQKPRMILVMLPALYLFCWVYGRSLLRRWEPYIFVLIASLPEAGWYMHAAAMERQTAVSAFNIPPELFAHHLDLWFDRGYLHRVLGALGSEALSPVGLGLAAVGFLFAARSRAVWVFRWYVLGVACVLLLIPGVIPNNLYYLSMLLPGGAALAAAVLARVPIYLRTPILAAFAVGAIYSALPMYEPDRMPHDLGILLRTLTEPQDLLATESGGSPSVLYYANRRGWLMEGEYNLDRVEHLQHAGAHYYVDTFLNDASRQPAFFRALDRRYQRLTADDAPWQIYDLTAPPGALSIAPRETPGARTVNFDDQIQFRGISIRSLQDWPPSFEVVNYWKCLKTPSAELRVFVHITNYSGRTVAQQDHWPEGGLFPTLIWAAGDIIRDRYVLTVPGTLAAGKYQVRVGWFDPSRGPRLPILNPTPSDEADSAKVAEIDVRSPPRYGWFSPD